MYARIFLTKFGGSCEMYYLEDLTYDIKTPPVKRIRNIITCMIILVGIGVLGYAFMLKQDLNDQFEANAEMIAGFEQDLVDLQAQLMPGIDDKEIGYYNPWDLGCKIADLQSSYGGFKENTSSDTIISNADLTSEQLNAMIFDENGKNPWYSNATCNYSWVYLTRQASTVSNIPSIWICQAKDTNTILAVTVGQYDGTKELFGYFKNYYTPNGLALITDDTLIAKNTSVINSVQKYDEEIARVEEIQCLVKEAEIPSENTELNND